MDDYKRRSESWICQKTDDSPRPSFVFIHITVHDCDLYIDISQSPTVICKLTDDSLRALFIIVHITDDDRDLA